MTQLIFEGAVRSTVPLLVAFPVVRLFRSRSAEARHTVWLMALLSTIGMLILPSILPQLEAPGVPAFRVREIIPIQNVVHDVAGWTVFDVLWAAPTLVLLALLISSMARINGWVRRAVELPETHFIRELADSLSSPREVRVLVSDEVQVPFVWGVFCPSVVVPRAVTDWSPADLRSTLVHEFGHIRRHDPFTRLVAEAVCCLLWFHPLVWICASRLREEGEAACDALVVADGRPRSDYARQLLGLTEDVARCRALASLAGMGSMRRRLNRLLHSGSVAPISTVTSRTLTVGWLVLTISSASYIPETTTIDSGTPVDQWIGLGPKNTPFHIRTWSDGPSPQTTEHVNGVAGLPLGEMRNSPGIDVEVTSRTVTRQVISHVEEEVTVTREVLSRVNRELVRRANVEGG